MTPEDLQRLDDLLSDAETAYWQDDSPLPKIAEARTLIERAQAVESEIEDK